MQITFSLHIPSWEDGFCLSPHLQSCRDGVEQDSHWAGGSRWSLYRREASCLLRVSLFLNKAVHNTVSTFPELLPPLPWEISTNTRKNNFKQWKACAALFCFFFFFMLPRFQTCLLLPSFQRTLPFPGTSLVKLRETDPEEINLEPIYYFPKDQNIGGQGWDQERMLPFMQRRHMEQKRQRRFWAGGGGGGFHSSPVLDPFWGCG